MTLQEIFNTTYLGLRAQGFERATDAQGVCQYRAPDGKRCAIGHCIPDKLYHPDIENKSANTVALILGGALPILQDNIQYLNILQSCHDSSSTPKAMKTELHEFATDYRLTIPE